MSIQTSVKGDVVVVNPEGMLVGGDETQRLEKELRGLIAHGKKKILLDLGRTRHLSSTGIGSLVSVHLNAANNGVAFFACNVDKRIENILTIFKLVNVLNVFGTREEALATLAKVDPARIEKPAPGPQRGRAEGLGGVRDRRGSHFPPGPVLIPTATNSGRGVDSTGVVALAGSGSSTLSGCARRPMGVLASLRNSLSSPSL